MGSVINSPEREHNKMMNYSIKKNKIILRIDSLPSYMWTLLLIRRVISEVHVKKRDLYDSNK